MTIPTSDPGSKRARTRPWRDIVTDCLVPMRGKNIPMEVIYSAVVRHPDAKMRATSNKHVRAKVRQTLQRLRDLGVVETRGPGRWHVKPDLHPLDATSR